MHIVYTRESSPQMIQRADAVFVASMVLSHHEKRQPAEHSRKHLEDHPLLSEPRHRGRVRRAMIVADELKLRDDARAEIRNEKVLTKRVHEILTTRVRVLLPAKSSREIPVPVVAVAAYTTSHTHTTSCSS